MQEDNIDDYLKESIREFGSLFTVDSETNIPGYITQNFIMFTPTGVKNNSDKNFEAINIDANISKYIERLSYSLKSNSDFSDKIKSLIDLFMQGGSLLDIMTIFNHNTYNDTKDEQALSLPFPQRQKECKPTTVNNILVQASTSSGKTALITSLCSIVMIVNKMLSQKQAITMGDGRSVKNTADTIRSQLKKKNEEKKQSELAVSRLSALQPDKGQTVSKEKKQKNKKGKNEFVERLKNETEIAKRKEEIEKYWRNYNTAYVYILSCKTKFTERGVIIANKHSIMSCMKTIKYNLFCLEKLLEREIVKSDYPPELEKRTYNDFLIEILDYTMETNMEELFCDVYAYLKDNNKTKNVPWQKYLNSLINHDMLNFVLCKCSISPNSISDICSPKTNLYEWQILFSINFMSLLLDGLNIKIENVNNTITDVSKNKSKKMLKEFHKIQSDNKRLEKRGSTDTKKITILCISPNDTVALQQLVMFKKSCPDANVRVYISDLVNPIKNNDDATIVIGTAHELLINLMYDPNFKEFLLSREVIVIADEIHIVSQEHTVRKKYIVRDFTDYMALLQNLKKINITKFIGLSGTIPNPDDLAEQIKILYERDVTLISSMMRPTRLNYYYKNMMAKHMWTGYSSDTNPLDLPNDISARDLLILMNKMETVMSNKLISTGETISKYLLTCNVKIISLFNEGTLTQNDCDKVTQSIQKILHELWCKGEFKITQLFEMDENAINLCEIIKKIENIAPYLKTTLEQSNKKIIELFNKGMFTQNAQKEIIKEIQITIQNAISNSEVKFDILKLFDTSINNFYSFVDNIKSIFFDKKPIIIYMDSCEQVVKRLSKNQELTNDNYSKIIDDIKKTLEKMLISNDFTIDRITVDDSNVDINQLVDVLLNLRKIGKGIIFTPLNPWSLVYGIISVIKRTLHEKYPYYDLMMTFVVNMSDRAKKISKEFIASQEVTSMPASCLTGAQKTELSSLKGHKGDATKLSRIKEDKDVTKGKKAYEELTDEFDEYMGKLLMDHRKNDKQFDDYVKRSEWNDYCKELLNLVKNENDEKTLKSIIPEKLLMFMEEEKKNIEIKISDKEFNSFLERLVNKDEESKEKNKKNSSFKSIWSKMLEIKKVKINEMELLTRIRVSGDIDKFPSLKYFAVYYKQDVKSLPETYIVPSEFCFTDNVMHPTKVKSVTHSLDMNCQVAFSNGIYPILPSTETVPNGGQPSYVLGKILEALENGYLGSLVVGGKMDDGTVRLSIGMNLAVSWVLIFDPKGKFTSTERKQMGARSGRYRIETNGIVVELVGENFENNVEPRVTIF